LIPGFSLCSNPGLKLANAFGVGVLQISNPESALTKTGFDVNCIGLVASGHNPPPLSTTSLLAEFLVGYCG
jgi:hypothetical protein